MRAEPGAELRLKIGSREYGPFRADERGMIEGRVDQYPGEVVASALLVDDLGNATRTEVPLATQTAPALLAVPMGEILPGRTPPTIAVWGVGPDGGAVGAVPSCRAAGSAGGDAMPSHDLGEGRHLVAVPTMRPGRCA